MDRIAFDSSIDRCFGYFQWVEDPGEYQELDEDNISYTALGISVEVKEKGARERDV